jgi:tetratricopeptide (TPR) repeat protein
MARALRRGYESLAEMGETVVLSTIAAYLAHALYQAARYDEVEHWTRVAEHASAPDDVLSQVVWRTARAKALARRGEIPMAERLARDGVRLAKTDENPNGQAKALMDLAEVLDLAGRRDGSAQAIEQAISRYDQKGNIVAAAAAPRQLSEAGAA